MATKKQQPKPMAELASRIASRWGGGAGEVALDRLVSELSDAQRYDIVAALKELEKVGAGTFEVGRAGRKARFVWSGKKLAVDKGKAAAKRAPAEEVPERHEVAQRVKLAVKRPQEPGPPHGSSVREQNVEAHGSSVRAQNQARAPSASELEHRFHLRPGFIVSVRLPSDVASSEVARFCQFLQAIPFGNGR